MTILEQILELFPDDDFLKMDGYDNAIIGFDQQQMKLVYSVPKCIEVLVEEQGMEIDDAIDHFEYNTRRSIPYVKDAPILMDVVEW